MDLASIIASPVTITLASVAAFVVGLIARPYVEARVGIFREAATSRRELQRATLTELQTLLSGLDPRVMFEPMGSTPRLSIERAIAWRWRGLGSDC